MGKVINKKLAILCGIFLSTSLIAMRINSPVGPPIKPTLKSYFHKIDEYETIRHFDLSEKAYQMLNLDDYLFIDQRLKRQRINLYVGYYYSSGKARASHSPLVCYPSQGWEIIEPAVKKKYRSGQHDIHYNEIVTAKGNRKELVLYWYQSYFSTNTDIYMNKIDMAYNRLFYGHDQHAFIRIAVPILDQSLREAETSALDFITAFYPKFLTFVELGSTNS
jgi:EpsI family protein